MLNGTLPCRMGEMKGWMKWMEEWMDEMDRRIERDGGMEEWRIG